MTTSTAGGSSGSPIFDQSWRLVGIHRASRSNAWGIMFGEAISIEAIMNDLREKKLLDLISQKMP